jgi:hypothetical protein
LFGFLKDIFVFVSFLCGGEGHVLVQGPLLSKRDGGMDRPVVCIDVFLVANLVG